MGEPDAAGAKCPPGLGGGAAPDPGGYGAASETEGSARKPQAEGRVGWALFWLSQGGDGRALPPTLCVSYSILCEIRLFPHPCRSRAVGGAGALPWGCSLPRLPAGRAGAQASPVTDTHTSRVGWTLLAAPQPSDPAQLRFKR